MSCLNSGARLVWLALASILLFAAVATGSSSRSKASSPAAAQTPSVQQADTARPEVVMIATRRDFGDVFAGEELEQSFVVRNAGTKPLELAHKSTLGMGSSGPGYFVTTAVWGANDHFMARRAAAMRVAPS